MEHVGIDLGAARSHVVVMTSDGEVVKRRQLATAELVGWLARRKGPTRVVMEACTQSPAVARASLAAGHSTVVVPGNLVRALGVGARGIKTDDRDAEILARASVRNEELPSVHLRSETSRSRRELIAARAMLVENRKRIATGVKSWLRGRLVALRSRAKTKAFSDAVRQVALESPDGLPMAIDVLLRTFEHLTEQIAVLDEEISRMTEGDENCTRLMSVPGVGPIVALAFLTQVDDVARFDSAERLASYLALVPGEATTGGKTVRTGTIKAGPSHLKALLVQAAWSMWRSRPNDPAVVWARSIAAKRGTRIAIVALARKIATVLYALWKHGTSYEPALAARARPETPSSAPPSAAAAATARPPRSRSRSKPTSG